MSHKSSLFYSKTHHSDFPPDSNWRNPAILHYARQKGAQCLKEGQVNICGRWFGPAGVSKPVDIKLHDEGDGVVRYEAVISPKEGFVMKHDQDGVWFSEWILSPHTLLNMFNTVEYDGGVLIMKFDNGAVWHKVADDLVPIVMGAMATNKDCCVQ